MLISMYKELYLESYAGIFYYIAFMSQVSLIETELKERCKYPYIWKRVQNNSFDRETNFIYDFMSFDAVVEKINWKFRRRENKEDYFNYALNRWYNYHSAMAIEDIFCSLPDVIPAKNKRDKLVDFSIQGIRFDHKSSVFPKAFPASLEEARAHPEKLIHWLYKNQSQQGRKHLDNRLFIVFFNHHGQHWKLKSELSWLKRLIESYMEGFDKAKLISLEVEGRKILSDVIFAVK